MGAGRALDDVASFGHLEDRLLAERAAVLAATLCELADLAVSSTPAAAHFATNASISSSVDSTKREYRERREERVPERLRRALIKRPPAVRGPRAPADPVVVHLRQAVISYRASRSAR